LSTDDIKKQDFIFALTHAALRIFALWLAVSSLAGVIFSFEGVFVQDTAADTLNVLALIHYGLYLLSGGIIWVFAPDLAARVLPSGQVAAPKTDLLNLLALILSGAGITILAWSVPVFLSALARLLWSFDMDSEYYGSNFWDYNGFLEHLFRAAIGLWLIRARFPIGQWLLKLRRVNAD
jgi:hypothetical protein